MIPVLVLSIRRPAEFCMLWKWWTRSAGQSGVRGHYCCVLNYSCCMLLFLLNHWACMVNWQSCLLSYHLCLQCWCVKNSLCHCHWLQWRHCLWGFPIQQAASSVWSCEHFNGKQHFFLHMKVTFFLYCVCKPKQWDLRNPFFPFLQADENADRAAPWEHLLSPC